MKYHLTDRKIEIIKGIIISVILITIPFLFYVYKFAPADETSWKTFLGTIEAGRFSSVQTFVHALFTKIILVLITGIWFLTSKNWWKYAILVPFTLFLFQLSGVINHKINYMDVYDFWDALPFILPIIFFLGFLSFKLSQKNSKTDLNEEADELVNNMFSDNI